MSDNPDLLLTLDEAVEEVLGQLTGLDLAYDPTYDRYRVIARALNRALRANALEHEWSWYAGTHSLGSAQAGVSAYALPNTIRPRVTLDDAARLVDTGGVVRTWAYFLPREALHKYGHRSGLWAAHMPDRILFSRPFGHGEVGLDIQIPVQREPVMFRLPRPPEDPEDPIEEVDDDVREQRIDFAYPDVITHRAAYLYAQTDPVMQPRVQTLEGAYKDLMYQAIERDTNFTDAPVQNEFLVPVQNGIYPESRYRPYPLADERL